MVKNTQIIESSFAKPSKQEVPELPGILNVDTFRSLTCSYDSLTTSTFFIQEWTGINSSKIEANPCE